MTILLLNRDRVKLFKNGIKPIIFVKFILFDKIDMKYEISVSKLTSSLNFSLISLKIKGGQKMDFDPGKNDVITGTSGDVINLIMVLDSIRDILAHNEILFQLTFRQ